MDAPIRLFLVDNKTLVCYDKDVKAFRDIYGKVYELLDTLKDNRNIHDRIEQLRKTYKFVEILFDCKVGRKFGWRFFNDETKERIREGVRAYRTGRKWDSETKDKISRKRKGKGNHNTRHRLESRMMTSLSMKGNTNVKGLRWAYNPFTGKEKRVHDLPEGFVWGRSPEILDYFKPSS
jgi:hypothetical protein